VLFKRHYLTRLLSLAISGDALYLSRYVKKKYNNTWPDLPSELKPLIRPHFKSKIKMTSNKRPRLLTVSPSFELTGAPLSHFELVSKLNQKGWFVQALAMADGPLKAAYGTKKIQAFCEPHLIIDPAVPKFYEKDVHRIAQYLVELAPDVVFANTIDSFPVIDACRIAGITSVWNIRESEPWRKRLAAINPKIAARALACFSYSGQNIFIAKSSLKAWTEFVPVEKRKVIYNAVPDVLKENSITTKQRNDFRKHLEIKADQFVILCLGTVCSRKGQEDLIRALKHLEKEQLKFIKVIFVGKQESKYNTKLRGILSEAGNSDVSSQVSFIGEVNNPFEYLKAADALVSCSRSEGFPRTFFEAAIMKRPIIATPVGGAKERLSHGVSAHFYEVGDCKSLSNSILKLKNDLKYRKDLVIGVNEAIIAKRSSLDMVNEYDEILTAACKVKKEVSRCVE